MKKVKNTKIESKINRIARKGFLFYSNTVRENY